MMAYLTYHCSAPLRCSVHLISFLLWSFVLSVLLLFKLYAPYPFSTKILFCSIQLLHSDSSSHVNHHSKTPKATANSNRNNNLISSLYRVFIASVHLVHAVFAMPLHADSAPLSSTSRVLCLIIIMTLQLLWWFTPRVQHHCMLYWDSSVSLEV